VAITRVLVRGDTKHANNLIADNGRNIDPAELILPILNAQGNYVDPQRVLSHPSFSQVEGQGILTYTYNPDETFNFILAPARGVDTAIHRTITGSIIVQQPQFDEDVIIAEVWTGTLGKLSILAEMFRTFHTYWLTIPDPGEYLTWTPADLSNESYSVEIVNVQLGDPNVIKYREVREFLDSRVDALLNETMTLSMKIVSQEVAPQGQVTLEGL
jgi:hypothetical protein